MKELGKMQDGQLGQVRITKQWIQLLPGQEKPVHCVPASAIPRAQEIESSEIKKMLEMKVNEPNETDGPPQFCSLQRKTVDLDFVLTIKI